MTERNCEILEARRLLSATLDADGALHVIATSAADVVGLSIKGAKLRVGVNDELSQFSAASVKSISIDLREGADYLAIAPGVRGIYCLGGLGDDTIFAGDGNDTITSGGGKDFVHGGAGDDCLDGGPTADHLLGDDGADRIYGGDANDVLEGGGGVDRLYAGVGNDQLIGGSSNDKLYGEDGADTLAGGNQNDLLDGGFGDDQIAGNDGNDTLAGQDGNDDLAGGKGDDFGFGDAGDDTLDGGSGNDSLDGGAGDDNLSGAAGLDSLSGGDGNDGLYGGADHDILAGNGGADRLLQRQRNNDDSLLNRSDDDAVVTFVDDDATWSDEEIARLDTGLRWLQKRTRNTKFLKRFNGGEMAILRVHDLGLDVLADNVGDGRIEIADLTFDFDDPETTIVHELGHNWDTEAENPGVKAFFDISHWRRRGGEWTHDPKADFANDYGRTNPYEDFATSFEVYFSQTKGPALWMAKWSYINSFLNSMSG